MKKWLKRYGRDLFYIVMLLVLSAVMYDQQKQINQWIGEIQRLKKETADIRRHLKNVEADSARKANLIAEESNKKAHNSNVIAIVSIVISLLCGLFGVFSKCCGC